MNITNQHCFHNCLYIKDILKDYGIYVKSVNGWVIQKKPGYCDKKLDHNWLEYDGEIIEPNLDIYKNKWKMYFPYTNKKKMYKKFQPSKDEKIHDIQYKKSHLKKYFRINKNFNKTTDGLSNKYLNMIYSGVVNNKLCNEINNGLKDYNQDTMMIHNLLKLGGKIHYY
tara:strand:+ start:109 stop:612 length:504 start_codon:yes stop_codon:yes gene_type:complete